MHKRASALIAALMICGAAFVSCSSKSSSSEQSGTTGASASTEAASVTENDTQVSSENGNKQTSGSGSEDQITPATAKGGDITGQWVPEGFDSGLDIFLDFGPDGSGALYCDMSGMVTLTDGKFSAIGIEASGDDLVIKDGTISAYYNSKDEDSLIIRLKRTDGGSGDQIDGEYTIEGGKLAETIYAYLDASFGGDSSHLPITAVINGSETLLKVAGAFTYQTEGSRLEIAIMEEFSEIAGNIIGEELYYTAEDDKLIITADGKSTVMPRRAK